MRFSRRVVIALPLAAACSGAGRALALYVSPQGEGDGGGWETAAPLRALADLLDRVAPGGTIYVAADRGAYRLHGPIELTSGGNASAPVRVVGVNSETGTPQAAVLRGVREEEDQGVDAFRLRRGADHLRFSHFAFHGFGNGCFRAAAPIADLEIEDCTFEDVYRFFENTAGRGERQASVRGFALRRCSGAGVERGFARIRYSSRGGVIEDCVAEGRANEGGDIPAGVALDDQAHDITLRRCVMRNFQQWRAGEYWNGDGFSDEPQNHDIVYESCEAYGATDGGFDCKSRDVVLRDCRAGDNKRNYRIWSAHATLTNCVSADPNFRGKAEENASACHIWIGHEEARVRIEGLTIADAGEPDAILQFEHNEASVEIRGVTIEAAQENWGDDAERVLASMIVSR